MQARGVLPQQIEVEDHVEIVEGREAKRISALTVSQFRPRQNKAVCVLPPCNEDHAILKQRRRVKSMCGVEPACGGPNPARRVVQFGARERNAIAVNSPCNKYHPVW